MLTGVGATRGPWSRRSRAGPLCVLAPCLRVLAEQLRRCAQQGEALLHTLAEAPDETGGHPMWRLCSPYLGSVARSPPGCLPKPPSP